MIDLGQRSIAVTDGELGARRTDLRVWTATEEEPDLGFPDTGSRRIALVHDYLSQFGGAERVVLELSRLFPDAPIFTSFYDAEGTFGGFRDREIVPSTLQRLMRPQHFRYYAPLYPRAFAHFDLRSYDLVVASSSAFAHRVHHPNCHVFCSTPPRFLYQPGSYGRSRWQRQMLQAASVPMRRADRRAARAKASYAANSVLSQRRIREAYGIESSVIYPPLATDHLPVEPAPLPDRPRLLMVSRLLVYKRVEVAIEVANATGLPLTIVGDGPERARLEALAGPSVELLGRVADEDIAEIFTASSVVLAPGVEDFGYGPVEAHWAGRPVVAIADGGALETVIHGVDGLLVDDFETSSWVRAVESALERPWSPEALRESARPFTPPIFRRRVAEWLDL